MLRTLKAVAAFLLMLTQGNFIKAFVSQARGGKPASRAVTRSLVTTSKSDAPLPNSSKKESNDGKIKVHQITWKTPDGGDIIFEALDGELLRTAALRRGLASPHNDKANLINCRGLGTCGTCAVALSDTNHGGDLPIPLNAIESFRLSVPPGHAANNTERLRLACQVPVHGNITVRKYNGFWGQHDQLVTPSQPTQPFGAAEFLLDRTSPSDDNTPSDFTGTTASK